MTDKIEPALTPKAWASIDRGDDLPYGYGSSVLDDLSVLDEEDIRAAIAYLNDRLPDADPRKITRQKIDALRRMIAQSDYIPESDEGISDADGQWPTISLAESFADALESYLPPEA